MQHADSVLTSQFKAIIVPFVADQYEETAPEIIELKTGEKVITDYQLTLQYIYNLFFWIGNIGSLSWFATVYIERQHGFASAYGLCLGFMVIAAIMLFAGKRWFGLFFLNFHHITTLTLVVKIPHKQNVLPQALRISLCAARHGFKMRSASPEYQLDHLNRTVSWSSTLVDELTRGLRACRVLYVLAPSSLLLQLH